MSVLDLIANLKSCMNELFKEYSKAHSRLVQNQASNSAQQPLRYCSEHEFKLYRTSIDLK
jgi:hypothetical protein